MTNNPTPPSPTPDEDPHEGLQAIYENGGLWWRYSYSGPGFDGWIFRTPDECQRLADAFANTSRTDWHYLKAQSLAKQLRNALEAYRKDNL